MVPIRTPRWIVNDDLLAVGADRDDIVIPAGSILEEEDERRTRREMLLQQPE